MLEYYGINWTNVKQKHHLNKYNKIILDVTGTVVIRTVSPPQTASLAVAYPR